MLSIRKLAELEKVSGNTLQRAFRQLEREGLVYKLRTKGIYVSKDRERLEAAKKEISSKLIGDLLYELGQLGYKKDELKELVLGELS